MIPTEPYKGPDSPFLELLQDSMVKIQDSMASPGLWADHIFTSENALFSDERIVWDSMDGRSEGGMWFRTFGGR